MHRRWIPVCLLAITSACSSSPSRPPAHQDAGAGGDAGDAGLRAEAGADAGADAGPILKDGGSPPAWFPFTIDGLDSTASVTDLSSLNAEAAGASGRVGVAGGHFVDGKGKRIRFFGVNLAANSCFPDKSAAPAIASHLRKLGVNLVRLHHMDFGPAPTGILTSNLLGLDAGQLDKLDYFANELEKNGIYLNINLHVSRVYPGLDSATAATFSFGKVLDLFYPPFVQLQKDYARDLLSRVNPYSGVAYTSDPGVLTVETNNEDTLFPGWAGSPLDAPEPYATSLATLWNAWLMQKYGNTAALDTGWKAGIPPLGLELLASPAVASSWYLEKDDTAAATLTVVQDTSPILRWASTSAGKEAWALQMMQTGLPLTDGTPYTLTFRARMSPGAAASGAIDVNLMLDEADWHNLGLGQTLSLTSNWQTFSLVTSPTGTVPNHGRLGFSLRNAVTSVDLGDISLRLGAQAGVPTGQTLEAGTIALPPKPGGIGGELADFGQFLADTELTTVKGLTTYLKDTLGLQAMVIDSQADYGGFFGLLRARTGSFVDMHAYWQHPSFPGTAWDPKNWLINNISQISDPNGGAVAGLAACRIAGMPFSVSEYNEPAPNDAQLETLPLLAGIAAFQDWDAIYAFDYLGFSTNYGASQILGFFDLAGNGGKLAFAPAAALAFRQALIQPGKIPVTLTVSDQAPNRSWDMGALKSLWSKAGASPNALAQRRLEVAITPGTGDAVVSEQLPATPSARSDTGEVLWAPDATAPQFTVNAKGLRLAAGQIAGQTIQLGDVTVSVGELPLKFATVELIALDQQPIASSNRVLLILGARFENTGMGWNAARTTVGAQWGTTPTIAELVPATITIPGTGWKASSLDAKGAAKQSVALTIQGGSTVLSTATADPSMWYVLTRN